jgi:hypothetical protein
VWLGERDAPIFSLHAPRSNSAERLTLGNAEKAGRTANAARRVIYGGGNSAS